MLASPEKERKERLKAWVQTYLREEIQAEALVRNLGGFMRFLPVAALFNSQIINISNVARDCGVERTTVAGYLEILNDTLITFHLPSYEAKLRVRERKHPKLYWLDPGVVRTARGDSGKVAEEERGALFESFVAQTLRSFQHCQSAWEEMFYWAPSEARGIEVDFLLKSGRDFVAIEVKSGTRLRPEWLKGLEAIAELPRLKRRILVYLGDRNMRTASGIDVVTLGTFLSELKANSLFHFDRRKP